MSDPADLSSRSRVSRSSRTTSRRTDSTTSRRTAASSGIRAASSTLFFTEMWERFSYYGLRPLLVLFMTAALARRRLRLRPRPRRRRSSASTRRSVYLASLPGGWVADRLLGLRRAIWIGRVLHRARPPLDRALRRLLAASPFFLGLVLIVLGTGLLKPNISAHRRRPVSGRRRAPRRRLLDLLHGDQHSARSSRQLITGFLGERVGWHWGFGAAGVGMLIGLLTFRSRAGQHARPARRRADGQRRRSSGARARITLGALAVVTRRRGARDVRRRWRIDPLAIANMMKNVILAMAVLYFAYLFFFAGLDGDERKRIVVVLVLFIFAVVFWSAFEQPPTSLNLFARDFTDRTAAAAGRCRRRGSSRWTRSASSCSRRCSARSGWRSATPRHATSRARPSSPSGSRSPASDSCS